MWETFRLVDTGGETLGRISWKHIPRIGDTFVFEGLAYRVADVTHNYDFETIVITLEEKED